MDHIGILPEPDAVLPTTVIPLFGLLANPKLREDEECHIFLEKISKLVAFIVETPCCGRLAHTECFQTWAESTLNATTIRCAYHRSVYN